jgi:tRNA threonylcarbamoyladenosine biosynthesis protein TsaE
MIRVFKLNDVDALAKELSTRISHPIVLFDGSMGMGKTTLIKALCKQLNVVDTVSSPTFSLINEYKTKDDKSIYHFDCYRLETPEEAYDFGAEEYLVSGSICLIEWAEKIQPLLPQEVHRIKLEYIDQNTRKIEFS